MSPARPFALVPFGLLTSLVIGTGARAQVCHPPADSHEARLLAFYEAPVTFSPSSAPAPTAPWGVRLDIEVAPIPKPGSDIEQTSLCYASKQENTRLAPLLARPRVTVGLPAGFAVEASYVPPIKVWDADPNLASFAISNVQHLPLTSSLGAFSLMLRAHGTIGRVKGPITCPTKSLTSDPEQPCYGATPSNDTFHPYMVGGEGAVALASRGGHWSFYAGGGVTRLTPRFQVGFTDGFGGVDTTKVNVNLTRGAAFGGVTAHVTHAVDLSVQIYSVPADVTTFRFGAGYRLR
jgi:hypothetical protein